MFFIVIIHSFKDTCLSVSRFRFIRTPFPFVAWVSCVLSVQFVRMLMSVIISFVMYAPLAYVLPRCQISYVVKQSVYVDIITSDN
jgi:hypothetical protein